MKKTLKSVATAVLAASALFTSACGDMTSTLSSYDETVQLEKIKFQAILGIGETVSVDELLEFTNSPKTDYDDVPKGNMRDVLKSMKRGVKGMDVSHYFWDFFHQKEVFDLSKERFAEYLNSPSGERFIDKFDHFLKTDDDDETPAIIKDSVLKSFSCVKDVCSLALIDIITGVRGTEKLTAYVLKIKGDQDFYDNMILNLKRDAESY